MSVRNMFSKNPITYIGIIPPREHPEENLPIEGVEIEMMTKDADWIEGYFLWSGKYVFIEVGEDPGNVETYTERHDILAWRYK